MVYILIQINDITFIYGKKIRYIRQNTRRIGAMQQ